MTEKMAHNREKMGAKLKVLKFILVLYSQPLISIDVREVTKSYRTTRSTSNQKQQK